MAGVFYHIYVAIHPIRAARRSRWAGKLRDAGLGRLTTVITLDTEMCPRVVTLKRMKEPDWRDSVAFDFLHEFHRHPDRLLARLPPTGALLGATPEPVDECADALPGPAYRFVGYDLMDRTTSQSLLLNAGPFPGALQPDQLNSVGLLDTLEAATAVKGALLTRYARAGVVRGSAIWALWALTGT